MFSCIFGNIDKGVEGGWGGRGYVGGKRGTPGSVSLETAALATHKFQKNGNHHFDAQILLGIENSFGFVDRKF